ncbi:hypothetical protein RJD24_21100 [Bacillaceae bacterium IKA-2]|nr:hypothetical protein RJD24_21100 [Bacillaceae bacterium IKA-2]
MDDKNVDKEIRANLLKNTSDALKKKEEIWGNIEIKLAIDKANSINNLSEREEINMKNERRTSTGKVKKKSKSRGWITGTIAAAVLLGIFTTSTDTGQAVVSNIKEYFAPEKQVVEEIEGMPEEKEVVLKESKSGYIIYIDEERYKLIEEDGIDKIVTKEPLGEIYPEVAMEISQVEDKTPEQLATSIQQELENSFETVREITTVTEPVEGLLISAIDGLEWDSRVTRVYIISNEKEGSFVIQKKYFLEAEEGHGARFHHMLKEFKIVENAEE